MRCSPKYSSALQDNRQKTPTAFQNTAFPLHKHLKYLLTLKMESAKCSSHGPLYYKKLQMKHLAVGPGDGAQHIGIKPCWCLWGRLK